MRGRVQPAPFLKGEIFQVDKSTKKKMIIIIVTAYVLVIGLLIFVASSLQKKSASDTGLFKSDGQMMEDAQPDRQIVFRGKPSAQRVQASGDFRADLLRNLLVKGLNHNGSSSKVEL